MLNMCLFKLRCVFMMGDRWIAVGAIFELRWMVGDWRLKLHSKERRKQRVI